MANARPAGSAKQGPARKRRKLSGRVDIEDVTGFAFSEPDAEQIRRDLLQWYDANHRVLPWRRNPHSRRQALDPPFECSAASSDLLDDEFIYRVWISETMSQQTQLSRVIEYFQRWVQKWPTVQALSKASLDEVNEAWAGLGYYRRARFLLEGAQAIAAGPGGTMPRTAQDWLKIPGVGAYTSRSVASIGCQEAVAAVDANVVRVLARLRRCSLPGIGPGATTYQNLATKLLDPQRPGDFNQAMMELGACICTSQRACCSECPLQTSCAAFSSVKEHQAAAADDAASSPEPSVLHYPAKAKKAQRREETWAVCLVERFEISNVSQLLMSKRPATGLLAGLWEFPATILPDGTSKADRAAATASCLRSCLERLGCPEEILSRARRNHLGTVTHVFSHINMTLLVDHVLIQADQAAIKSLTASTSCEDLKWMQSNRLDSSKLSSSVQKIVKLWKAAPSEPASLKTVWAKHACKGGSLDPGHCQQPGANRSEKSVWQHSC
ncbi:hypothetical protein WJX74_005883 [Apatococcus lobatus]|uniref:Adenine DNA glycosylase n=1 Tax=Apatococcus lobatus TaxID=904363 RepID=A0AAW1QVJ8_9CHLO